ncbi:Xaa-Pro peptidase family protein [Methanonatronarchaeum sp. AMET-Sl]|uniref:M24 family metallopeptidase n=1 Tax=Methanonatronarchaeum sp. AMET-Sl TaxID=3037654 RepID=UPI00244DE78F|nr:Xaa-Pro peptidase family protein [Methanonatronarchaeum sp. AMET-Sl]WGI17238.1 Xaa-Pro peptidase family protein [Methanonatronarchaeum sp. AMET-Sl]
MVLDLLEEKDLDCLLVFSESYHNSNMYYLSSFLSGDPFVYFKTKEKECLVVPGMEVERAREDSDIEICSLSMFGEEQNRYLGAIKKLLNDYDCNKIGVPDEFPVKISKKLSEFDLFPIDLSKLRDVKDNWEVDYIEGVQKTAESGMEVALEILKESELVEGKLFYKDKPLTSDYIRYKINIELLRNNCISMDTIVSSGNETASPHKPGSGVLDPTPIIIDIFPKNRENRYCGDITRTFSKTKNEKAYQVYQDVQKAQEIGFKEIKKNGVTGAVVHNAVCEYFENKGYDTPRTGGETGFIHSTGHGVGLDLHEHPRLGKGGSELKKGHVVTIEPGIYDPSFGGIRIEDLVVITEKSFKNLTSFDKEFYI